MVIYIENYWYWWCYHCDSRTDFESPENENDPLDIPVCENCDKDMRLKCDYSEDDTQWEY